MAATKKNISKKTDAKKEIATKKATVVASQSKKVNMGIMHLSLSGESKEAITLPQELTAPLNKQLFAQMIRVYRMNERQGTQNTKTRGEVEGSSRKIYRQKGTGRARHGSIRAPIFVGGGIVFGPKPRNFHFSLPQKMRNQALQQSLSDKIAKQQVTVISGLEKASGKTRDMQKLLNTVGVARRPLLVIESKMENAIRAARNIADVAIRSTENISAYDIYSSDRVIVAKEVFTSLISRMQKRAVKV